MESLTDISLKYNTDKSTAHKYTKIYEKYLNSIRNNTLNLLEIGIGGYDNSEDGGGSLKMWRDYFIKGQIIGLDIEKKILNLGERIHIFQGSQDSKKDLDNILSKFHKLDIIIDDGSHLNKHQVKSFELLFPYLNKGGYYFIEDIQSSYILNYGGDGFYLNNKKTAINYFKTLIDKINFQEIENPFFQSDYFCKNITEIHFYHNLIVIKKDDNNEKSNIILNNRKYPKGKNLLKLRKYIKLIKYFMHLLRSRYDSLIDKFKF